MESNHSELVFENQWLEQVISLAKEQLERATLKNEDNKSTIISLKKEMRDSTSHSISGLWSSQNFEDLVALSQFTNSITDEIANYDAVANKIQKLEKLLCSPYFARIDFQYEDEDNFEKIYIGRSSLTKDGSYEIVVYDWRSPIASVFYRFGMGQAFYDAPNGRITGEVNLKRQYEINKGVLEYFFDADIQIMDEFLRKMLSQNMSSKMKTIVETIQKEQDIVIRDMENGLMMVQGVAGSGKTSIALHRAAYLMYQGLSAKLSAHNIVIISPNPLFEQYISNVLPELGEDNIVSVVFEEILMKLLQNKRIQSRNEFLEYLISDTKYRTLRKNSIEFKTSRVFLELLHRFIEDLPRRWASFEDITYDGKRDIKKEIQKFAVYHAKVLYQKLIDDSDYFYHLAKDLKLPDCISDILVFTQENLCSNVLYYDDASVIAFLKLKITGFSDYKNIKQVVIDEAQDYYPLHYEMLNLLFPGSKYTILGDINQTLEKQEDLSLYEQISTILNKKKSILVTMDKSFRCTSEILRYSSKFIPSGSEIKSFNRSGDKPEIYIAADQSVLTNMIISEIQSCLEKGYRSIGLICKTGKNALALFNHLKDSMDVQLIQNDSTTDLHGIFMIPVSMSKGIEFDAVLLCDADCENYHSEDDKKILYIACTRALHRLNLFCKGEVSPLL